MNVTSRSNLIAWLDGLVEQYTVIAPRMVEEELLYRPVASGGEVVIELGVGSNELCF